MSAAGVSCFPAICSGAMKGTGSPEPFRCGSAGFGRRRRPGRSRGGRSNHPWRGRCWPGFTSRWSSPGRGCTTGPRPCGPRNPSEQAVGDLDLARGVARTRPSRNSHDDVRALALGKGAPSRIFGQIGMGEGHADLELAAHASRVRPAGRRGSG